MPSFVRVSALKSFQRNDPDGNGDGATQPCEVGFNADDGRSDGFVFHTSQAGFGMSNQDTDINFVRVVGGKKTEIVA